MQYQAFERKHAPNFIGVGANEDGDLLIAHVRGSDEGDDRLLRAAPMPGDRSQVFVNRLDDPSFVYPAISIMDGFEPGFDDKISLTLFGNGRHLTMAQKMQKEFFVPIEPSGDSTPVCRHMSYVEAMTHSLSKLADARYASHGDYGGVVLGKDPASRVIVSGLGERDFGLVEANIEPEEGRMRIFGRVTDSSNRRSYLIPLSTSIEVEGQTADDIGGHFTEYFPQYRVVCVYRLGQEPQLQVFSRKLEI
jgi:hypothetical protein